MEDKYFDLAVSGSLNLAHIHGGLALLLLSYRKFDAVAFRQAAESLRDDRTVMNKHILSRIPGDEAVPLLVVKLLDNPGFASALSHCSSILGKDVYAAA